MEMHNAGADTELGGIELKGASDDAGALSMYASRSRAVAPKVRLSGHAGAQRLAPFKLDRWILLLTASVTVSVIVSNSVLTSSRGEDGARSVIFTLTEAPPF
jgi:hypothetical protein